MLNPPIVRKVHGIAVSTGKPEDVKRWLERVLTIELCWAKGCWWPAKRQAFVVWCSLHHALAQTQIETFQK